MSEAVLFGVNLVFCSLNNFSLIRWFHIHNWYEEKKAPIHKALIWWGLGRVDVTSFIPGSGEAVSRIWNCILQVRRQQSYHCSKVHHLRRRKGQNKNKHKKEKNSAIRCYFVSKLAHVYVYSLTILTCSVVVAIHWKRYQSCRYPLHIWIVVGSLYQWCLIVIFLFLIW